MRKKRFLITAGPTREYIDPVRFISNDSSGKMGFALADAALKSEADVVLVTGPVDAKPRLKNTIKVIKVISAEDMFREVKRYFDWCDVLICCAAVSDYRPARLSTQKIKKTEGPLFIKLVPNPDILSYLTHLPVRHNKVVVGFSLETENPIENAYKKLIKKKLDIIVVNSPDVMGSDRTTGAIITKDELERFNDISKKLLAKKIIEKINSYSD